MKNKQLYAKVEEALDTMRPYLASDGGNVEIIEITEDFVLKLKLLGACSTCPQSYMTMKAGIEEAVKKAVPQIMRIDAINLTPHPYLENIEDQL